MDTNELIEKLEKTAKMLWRDGVLYHIAELLDEAARRLRLYKQVVDVYESSADQPGREGTE
ncbi:MAG: hypothetical protein J6Q84_07155 [Kiritimatiellae bacterium]|nr:hypothetical protein [Kiritimatiellia bacterium]